MRWTLDEIARALGGDPLGDPGTEIASVSTDSRALGRGALFVPLVGERFDGHAFAGRAAEAGAAACLWGRGRGEPPPGLPRVDVEDTLRALGALARAWRDRCGARVVAVAGSNGKTTTKEMLAAALGAWLGEDRVLKTRGNLNNEIGVPLTLFGLEERHEAAVIEMGMNHPGELARLARIGRPDFGVITNVGAEHMMSFAGLEEVARAECELLDAMPAGGAVAVNGDDALLVAEARRHAAPLVLFGLGEGCEVRAEGVESFAGGARGALVRGAERAPFEIAVHGLHNVYNAVAAAAGASLLGAPLADVARGLARFRPEAGRSALREAGGVRILDDTYNANPDSMARALETVAALARDRGGAAWAALGEMLELGERAAEFHEEVGRAAAEAGVKGLVVVGERAEDYARGARGAGLREVTVARSRKDAVEALSRRLRPGDWCLVKGSRGARMEEVVQGIERCFTT